MISEATAWRICDLHSQGYRQTAIARQVQVSRATVVRVIHGAWKPRRFRPRQVLRLLELWDTALALMPGTLVGECRACGEPVYLPCVSCLVKILDLFGVRTPIGPHRRECACGGSFLRIHSATAGATQPRRVDKA